ncbi:GNAT family N-acetyltransferase [Flammeovirgaceae bacterium SG7u.111]|nr:GNAT family N-acetyltransferase [Flammeovirgaceae bacterium SG7u.132]WPO34130.1 GNAT family N-acetyltransferase [Flammeovirgaceae bacterium SG7u.111]
MALKNLHTERLILQEISWEDLNEIHRLHSTPEVDEFNTLGIPQNLEETRVIITPWITCQASSPRKLYTWKVILKESGEFLGLAGLTLSQDKYHMGEIYYKLLPTYWGKGYATEASKAMVKAGFDEFGLHKIDAGVATANTKSARVLEKIGMTREGLRRKILPIRGQWVDNYHYGILEDDPRDY